MACYIGVTPLVLNTSLNFVLLIIQIKPEMTLDLLTILMNKMASHKLESSIFQKIISKYTFHITHCSFKVIFRLPSDLFCF